AAFEIMVWPAPESKVKAVAVPDIPVAAPASSEKVSVPPTRFNVAGARRSSSVSSQSLSERCGLPQRERGRGPGCGAAFRRNKLRRLCQYLGWFDPIIA